MNLSHSDAHLCAFSLTMYMYSVVLRYDLDKKKTNKNHGAGGTGGIGSGHGTGAGGEGAAGLTRAGSAPAGKLDVFQYVNTVIDRQCLFACINGGISNIRA